MTLIVALSCKDGIVFASDGQATGSSSAGPIRQKMQKIVPIEDNILFGASGSIGTIQRSYDVIRQFSKDLTKGLSYGTMENIRKAIFPIMKNEVDRHKSFHGKIDGVPIADILICFFDEIKGCKIWHIAPDCSDELLQDIGYACTGNGDVFAYTILENFDVKKLSCEKGKFLAYKVIKDSMKISAYGLGEPIDVWIMGSTEVNGKKTTVSKKLTPEEIDGLEDTYLSFMEAQSNIFDSLSTKKK